MGFWAVIWIVFMILWLFGGGYWSWDPARPQALIGGTVIPWACVAILGAAFFGAIAVGPIR